MEKEKTFHQRIKEEKRKCVIQAATGLFFEQGYERTSLSQIAKKAGVSTGTLFNHFPTKAAIFEGIVAEFWELEEQYAEMPSPGDPTKGLKKLGRDYACLLTREGMQPLFKIIIAEAKRFPEISKAHYTLGEGKFQQYISDYMTKEVQEGNLHVSNIEFAVNEFMSLIAGQVFWPNITSLSPQEEKWESRSFSVVDEAVCTMLLKYGVSGTTKRQI